MQCVHFIGFRDTKQYWLACQVFGKPDFIHIKWDIRAAHGGEIADNDILVFASGKEWEYYTSNSPYPFSVDDSNIGIPSDEELTKMGL